MPFKFNPFSGNFDQTGSGGGGSTVFDGEVQFFSDLPQTVGTPPINSAYLVRESEGTIWFGNKKQKGIYIRSGNSGVRNDDWTYGGEYPVTSVAGRTGAITLTSADITDATANATAGTIVKRNANDGSASVERLLIYNSEDNVSGEIVAQNLTQGRSYQLPNASGTISLEGHGERHNAGGLDPIYNEMVAIQGSGDATINGYYYLANDGGDVDYIKIGSTRRARMVFLSSRWQIRYDGVTLYQSEVRQDSNKPWNSTTWTATTGPSPAPTVTQADVDSVLDEIGRVVDYSGVGKLGSTANLPVLTGANGVLTTGTFGTSANTFVEGNDTRLSDSRSPSAHSSSHATGGSDPLAPSDIGAAASNHTHILATDISAALAEDPDICREALNLGDMATEPSSNFSQSSHTHGNLTNDGKIGSTAGLPVVTTTAGAVTTLALGTANQVLRVNSGASGVEFADPAAAGVTSVTGTAPIVSSGGTTPAISVTIGSTANTVCAGDDSRLSDARTPLSHVHSGSDITSGTVGTARLGTGTADSTTFLRGDGTWATPTASGGGTKTYAVWSATANQPPATSFATLDTRNSIACLDFSDTATESAVFVGVMPEAAVLTSGLIVRLYWMGTATTGDVRWSVAFERGNTDLDTDSFDTATAATATTNGTSGIVTVTAITCTNIDSIAAGDLFRLRVQRLGADAADTMIGAKGCELVAVEIRSAA